MFSTVCAKSFIMSLKNATTNSPLKFACLTVLDMKNHVQTTWATMSLLEMLLAAKNQKLTTALKKSLNCTDHCQVCE